MLTPWMVESRTLRPRTAVRVVGDEHDGSGAWDALQVLRLDANPDVEGAEDVIGEVGFAALFAQLGVEQVERFQLEEVPQCSGDGGRSEPAEGGLEHGCRGHGFRQGTPSA